MAVRTTIDIPETLHETLRQQAEKTGTSIRSLVVRALEETYGPRKKGKYVTGPLVKRKGKLGPRFPVDENPHDLVFS
jgi:hypothetical protein